LAKTVWRFRPLSTDAEGHVSVPKLSDFVREQAPLAYQVSKGAAILSFLPYGRHDRYLDFSRFPIEGIHDSEKPQGLQAYLFSDRGIYRPGDEIRIGLIVKSQDWKQKLGGVPLELSVDDARGVTVRREKIRLSDAGFEEIRHQTLEASATGTWNVNVHIVKDGQAEQSARFSSGAGPGVPAGPAEDLGAAEQRVAGRVGVSRWAQGEGASS
jgi:uncharacterized protein YfaS (alpha-2-macroglobulin family)